MSEQNIKTKVTINWNDQKAKLRQKFSALTEKDLQFEQGKMEEMIARIQDKVGITRHVFYQIITKV